MASYNIIFQRDAEKELRQFPEKDIKRILKVIDFLRDEPFPVGVKKLVGSDFYRIRIGTYRVIYQIKNKELIIVVLKVGHRKNIYR